MKDITTIGIDIAKNIFGSSTDRVGRSGPHGTRYGVSRTSYGDRELTPILTL